MKKLLLLSSLTTLFASSSYAKDGVYIGADAIYSKANHKYEVVYKGIGTSDGEGRKESGNDLGVGFNAGYKMSFGQVFVAPEVFYDYLNNEATDFFHDFANAAQDVLRINSRYGAKLNLGYHIAPKFNVFLNAGVANVDYDVEWPSVGSGLSRSYGASKLAPVYGVGLGYDLTDHWAVKASYDNQKFNIKYVDVGRRDSVNLHVYKLGVVYGF